jgi:hypothetical protein
MTITNDLSVGQTTASVESVRRVKHRDFAELCETWIAAAREQDFVLWRQCRDEVFGRVLPPHVSTFLRAAF